MDKISTWRKCAYSLFLLLMMGNASCAILFPDSSAPKSGNYKITPPQDPWKAVPVGEISATLDAQKADLAFEDTRTGAIISLNSLCHKYTKTSLEELSRNLVLGIKDKNVVREKKLEIAGGQAMDTTIQGEVEGAKIQIRTVVLKRSPCTYDFIHVTVPEKAEVTEKDFDIFIASFEVK
jgi:hypothetical protein